MSEDTKDEKIDSKMETWPGSGNVVDVKPDGMPPAKTDILHAQVDTDEMIQLLERRANVLSRLLDVAIRATHAGQWTNQGGKPFPTASAAEVMARRCLVSLRDVKCQKVESSDDKGPYYLYVCSGTFHLPGVNDSVEAIGTCSVRDQFFSQARGEDKPLHQIDEGNIMKAAYSNMMVNGVTRLLGVRNLTWERLSTLGINQSDSVAVDYRGSSRTTGTSANDPLCKFGKWKGRTLSSLSEKDLYDLVKVSQEIVDKKDEKWHAKNVEWLASVTTEVKRRTQTTQDQQTNSSSVTDTSGSASAAGENGSQSAHSSHGQQTATAQLTVYQKILDMAKMKYHVETKDDIHAAIKAGTGKSKASELTDDDVDKVDQVFAKWDDELNKKEEAEWH